LSREIVYPLQHFIAFLYKLDYYFVGGTIPRMGKRVKMLTPRQYADAVGVAYTTVMNWLRQGRIPEAIRHATPTGHYWEVPATASRPKLQPGRPKASKKGSKK
jgi:hypothetical protein